MNRALDRAARLQFPMAMALVAMVLLVQHGSKLANFGVPLHYTGDGMFNAMVAKSLADVGWFPWNNPYLGAPFGSSPLDFPMSDAANFVVMKVLSLFGDWVFVTNAFIFATYFTIAASSYWVLTRFGLLAPWPLIGAVLFAFASYHPMRAGHLFLASYFVVPLGAWLAWTVWRADREADARDRIATWVCAVLVGAGGVYYAAFGFFLVALAMLTGLAAPDRGRVLARGALILAMVGGTVLLNVTPTLVYKATHGPNPEVAIRPYADTERYALKVIQLVLPRPAHRIEAADQFNRRYSRSSDLINENATSPIGIVAVIGLAFLLWHAVARMHGAAVAHARDLAGCLSAFTLGCILLGTIGGFGAILSFFISAQIRAYNRISIVIAFLALTAFLLLASRLLASRRASPGASWAVAAVVLAVGLFDQTAPNDLAAVSGSFESDRRFVRELEGRVREGAMVYQMPYQRYPEVGRQFELETYGPMRGYLHSRTLRWSYGHVKGRDGDRWMARLHQLPLPEQIDAVAKSGFEAVVVERRGFKDRGRALEEQLRRLLGAPVVESGDGLLSAYRLSATGSQPVPIEQMTATFARIDFTQAQLPASVSRISGFSVHEPWGRWTEGPVARIETSRELPREFVLEIESVMAFHPNVDAPIVVTIGDAQAVFRVTAGPTRVELPFRLERPASAIEIKIPRPVSPAELGAGTDPRKVGIGVRSIALRTRPRD